MHVLVVDDDESIRQTMADALELIDHQVETAANGAEALERMRRRRPDAVFLDLMMPVMDGWRFAEVCRQDPRCAGVPIAVISAVPELATVAQDLHARAWVPKPFDLVDLWAAAGVLERGQ